MSSEVSNVCSKCSAPLSPDVPGKLCLKCLLGFGLQSVQSEEEESAYPPPLTSDTFGNYRLLEKIGEGGCGVVYRAEQLTPIKRTVALKVIKLGMDTQAVIARFETERQALALMEHPHIAKVLDAGASSNGRPFFVMELVRGERITDYCDRQRLSVPQRLELFADVCLAIQHAHQKGVIHRDIKPSNILVTEENSRPVPKVIDFGVARATTQQRLTDHSYYTAFDQFVGTPAYMSPEQAGLRGEDVDTRSDVYSLGVLLYELLTGKTPFDAKELFAKGLDEVRRIIREEEPPRPSTRLSALNVGEQTTLSNSRQSEPPKLMGIIQGDLDWVVMKTLEKDRTRRYETANGLAMEIERYLNDELIMARPPSQLYRLQKVVRRNKFAVASFAAIIAALILGLLGSMWQAKRAEAGERRAQIEASKSEQVSQFLKEMLQSVGPSVAKGRDTTMLREILDKTKASIEKDLSNQPDVQLELQLTLARSYNDLQLFVEAEDSARKALTLAGYERGAETLKVAQALGQLLPSLNSLRKLDEAEKLHRYSIALNRKLRGPDSAEEADNLMGLCGTLRLQVLKDGLADDFIRLDNAEAAGRKSLEISKARGGEETHRFASALAAFTDLLRVRGKLDEAELTSRASLAIRVRLVGAEDPSCAAALYQLGYTLLKRGKLIEAEDCLQKSAKLLEKYQNTNGWYYANGLIVLGDVLNQNRKYDEAESCLRRVIPILKERLSAQKNLPDALCQLASLLQKTGKIQEAQKLYSEAVELYQKLANSGMAGAYHKLGYHFETGLGVLADNNQAAQFYRKAAEQNYTESQNRLGSILFSGASGLEKNIKEALYWKRKVADRGNPNDMNELAWILATIENADFRDATAALNFAERAVKATSRTNGNLLDTLAVALAEAGQFSNAASVQIEAAHLFRNRMRQRDAEIRARHYAEGGTYLTFLKMHEGFGEKYAYSEGYLVKYAGGTNSYWKEQKSDSGIAFYFEEIARTNGVIVLEDASRNYLAKFQTNGGTFWLSNNRGKTWRYFYNLTRQELDGNQDQPQK